MSTPLSSLKKHSDYVKQKPLLLLACITVLAIVIASLVTVYFTAAKKNDPTAVSEQRMLTYAVLNDCSRTKLEGVIWWHCSNGWWEELELYNLANGKYHVDGAGSKEQT